MGFKQFDVIPQKFRITGRTPEKVKCAIRYFRRACELGKREAFRYLGDAYYDGIGTDRCFRIAVGYYEQGVARGDAGSKFALGLCYEVGSFVTQSFDRAIKLYKEAMDDGCGEAMEAVGYNMLVPSSYNQAARLLGKAASMSIFAAKESYGLCYYFGLGVERDSAKAFKLFNESFQGGNLFAARLLAECYDIGCVVERNRVEATAIYERCVKVGSDASELAQPMIGLRIMQGIGVEEDEARGKKLILDAKNSNPQKWFALGECYRYGFGFKQNYSDAKHYYRKAVNCGANTEEMVEAYIALAEMFESGDGVVADIRPANKFYLIAADHRQPKAQWKVAVAYELGVGLPKNVHRAVFYFEMCANSGNPNAQRKRVSYYVQGHGVERPRDFLARIITEAARSGN